jgi:hypothetical protein
LDLRRLVLLLIATALLGASTLAQTTRSRRVETKPAVSSHTPLAAAPPAPAPAAFAALPFAPVETLSYSVDWNDFLKAANLDLTVAERGKFFGREGFRLSADVRTVGLVRTIAAVLDARLDTYADPKTLLPYRTERRTSVNGQTKNETITYNRSKGVATTAEGAPLAIGAETSDVISLFYRVRALPLKVEDSFTLDVLENGKRSTVRATVDEGGEISTPAGRFKSLRVSFVPIRNGQPDDSARLRVWYSDDRSRLPLLITAQPKIGPIKMTLTRVATGMGLDTRAR